jgi:poly(hydroxyalkanoate) depolymerase family esterase
MNSQFAAAISRALEQTRAGNTTEATQTIQAALNGAEGAAKIPPSFFASNLARQSDTPPRRRRTLGQVVEALTEGRGRIAPLAWKRRPGQVDGPEVPAGAQYLSRNHATSFGRRDYRLFVPSPREEPIQGVIVMLHGCTQTADDFATGTGMNAQAECRNFVVVYPQQRRTENAMACWNWFMPEHQGRNGEPAIIADLARTIAEEHDVAPGRIFAAGLSAGGAMAAILGAAHPDVFRAVGVHSGLAAGSASDVAGAYAAMRGQGLEPSAAAPVRTIVFQGSADGTVHPGNAESVLRAALGTAKTVEIEEAPRSGDTSGSRSFRRILHQDVSGRMHAESWTINGAGHAWSGGAPGGSYTDPAGPDASAEMIRFFIEVAREELS